MGFSADWLSLREPADMAARDATLLRQAAEAAGPDPVVLDLGCGTGATVRALGPHLPASAKWHLVDNDPDLLPHAAAAAGDGAQTHELDLRRLEDLPLDEVTIVTASALLDLASEDWVRALAARLDVPFYAALSYDGHMGWTPLDPEDAAVTDTFNADQQTDKGFGPAMGPEAGDRSAAAFEAAGFDVRTARSPWRLGPDAAALQAELVRGIAGAAGAGEWGQRRVAAAGTAECRVGHIDLLAIPGGGA